MESRARDVNGTQGIHGVQHHGHQHAPSNLSSPVFNLKSQLSSSSTFSLHNSNLRELGIRPLLAVPIHESLGLEVLAVERVPEFSVHLLLETQQTVHADVPVRSMTARNSRLIAGAFRVVVHLQIPVRVHPKNVCPHSKENVRAHSWRRFSWNLNDLNLFLNSIRLDPAFRCLNTRDLKVCLNFCRLLLVGPGLLSRAKSTCPGPYRPPAQPLSFPRRERPHEAR